MPNILKNLNIMVKFKKEQKKSTNCDFGKIVIDFTIINCYVHLFIYLIIHIWGVSEIMTQYERGGVGVQKRPKYFVIINEQPLFLWV